jgi:hypothetical protein
VLFKSDRRCCVCQRVGHQVHHLDRNHANNAEDNLALLCFECHDEATAGRGLRVRLDEATIRRFRKAHYRAVALHRAVMRPLSSRVKDDRDHFTLMLEAVQVAAVRQTVALIDPGDFTQNHRLLETLLPYASEAGRRVRVEVLEATGRLASSTRFGIPFEAVQLMATIIETASVRGMPWFPGAGKPSREELVLLEYGASIGAEIAFDGAQALGDLAIVNEGSDVLWLALRCARMNSLSATQSRLLEFFEYARDGARKARGGPFVDAVRWLEFKEADALSLPGDALPEMPRELEAKIDQLEGQHRSRRS